MTVTAGERPAPTAGPATAAERLTAERPPRDRVAGWLVTLSVTALALFLRLWHLGRPAELAFDETYYAKDGWSLWRHGYARQWVEGADRRIERGDWSPALQERDPTMVVHPEVGKWLIGAGEQVLGLDPVGWRIASALTGALMVFVVVRLVRRLTRSTALGGIAGLLVCLDGLQLVLSRLALLDIYVATFLLCGVSCLVADRDWTRARMAALSTAAAATGDRTVWGPVAGLWWRPWRAAAGVMLGLAVASKWSALLPLAAFGLLVVSWDAGARRALGVRGAWWRSALVDGVPAFAYLVGLAFTVYVASWAGWLAHADVYEAALARNAYGPYWGDYTLRDPQGFWPSTTQGLRSLWHYHRDVWHFHSTGLLDATHSYQSSPGGWPLLHRPVAVATELGVRPGADGCDAPRGSSCLRVVVLLGNPAVWWAGVGAMAHSLWQWVARRDWRHGVAVVGFAAVWLPFFPYAGRPIFSFYAAAMLPFLVVSLALLAGRVLGPPGAGPRRFVGAVTVGFYLGVVVLVFAWLWPVLTYELLTNADWQARMWLRSWI